ncbi:transposase [Azospirillum sp.]|uniref:transposase n=1 Tax=Azospirillum sp. TaxID=34012 RepID=UPI00261DF926|nr:transposase [Azospirillum sp.]
MLRTTPGGQARYSDTAIETAVMVRLVFHQSLRQTEGLLNSLLDLMGVDLPVPDHTTISRRAARRTPVLATALSAGSATLGIHGVEGLRGGRVAPRQAWRA